jgi:hypothetical protein
MLLQEPARPCCWRSTKRVRLAMTWVVGASSLFGYGVMVSDVRVSWNDGTHADLLRKSYRVAPFILAGFAGSVDIGLRLIGDMQNFLTPPDASAGAWDPEWVANNWAPRAARLFAASPAEEQDCGAQIIIVGVSPDQRLGASEFPLVYNIKLDWPDFRPAYLPTPFSVCHIGNGSDVDQYEKAIADFFDISSPTLQAATAGPAAWAHMLGHSVGRLVADNPTEGISPHVHIQTCCLGNFYEGNNNTTRVYPDGRRVDFQMPKIASTYAEFLSLCKTIGKAATAAVA